MFTHALKIHRFLRAQSFYPLALSTLLALGVFVVRVIYSRRDWELRWLVWNLFLAWIPYLCSLVAVWLERTSPPKYWAILATGFIWLAFFPNAPYLVTDFYHLYDRPPVPLWYDIGLIATYAFSGCFLGIASLRAMQSLVRRYMGRWISWFFVLVTIGLSGLGVYLGRFGRYNSWDLLLQPKAVIKVLAQKILDPLDNLGFIGFTMMFTAILLVFYLMFASSQPAVEASNSRE